MASFNIEQKNEILAQMPKSSCCRRSLLHGALVSGAICSEDGVIVRLENQTIADAIIALIKEFFGKECIFLPKKKGERSVSFFFKSPAVIRYLSEQKAADKVILMPKCKVCASAFLQGVFLAVGHVVSPEKQYCLELFPQSGENALCEFLFSKGIEMHRSERNGRKLLYLRGSGAIEDFFATAQMNATAFRFMNAKIRSDFLNNANRISNCDTGNIAKTLTAAERHLKAIRWLEKRGLLSTLPEELLYTARLRLEHVDFSLSLLAATAVPPLSKPGLTHRLNRIVAIADRLAAEEKNEKKRKRKE